MPQNGLLLTLVIATWKGILLLRFLARSLNYEKRLLESSFLSVRPSAWNNSAPTGRIFMKFDI